MKALVLLLSLVFIQTVYAGEFTIRLHELSTAHNWPHPVSNIAVKPKGYDLFVGTYSGLVLYKNGNAMVITPPTANNKNWGNVITYLHESDGNLWVGGPMESIWRLKLSDFSWEEYPLPKLSGSVSAILSQGDTIIYVGTSTGRFLSCQMKSKAFKLLFTVPIKVTSIKEYNGNIYWIANKVYELNKNGTIRFNSQEELLEHHDAYVERDRFICIIGGVEGYVFARSRKDGYLQRIEGIEKGKLLMYKQGQEYHFIRNSRYWYSMREGESRVTYRGILAKSGNYDDKTLNINHFVYEDGKFWISTPNGFFMANTQLPRFEFYYEKSSPELLLRSSYIRSIYVNDSNLFVGFKESGFQIFDKDKTKGSWVSGKTNALEDLGNIHAFLPFEGGYVIGGQRFLAYHKQGKITFPELVDTLGDKVWMDHVWYLAPHPKNKKEVLVMSNFRGTTSVRPVQENLKWPAFPISAFGKMTIWNFYYLKGKYWACAEEGLFMSEDFEHWKEVSPALFGKESIWYLADKTTDEIYIGSTRNGLMVYNVRTGQLVSDAELETVREKTCSGLFYDLDSNLWYLTTNGFYLKGRRESRFRYFGRNEGLPAFDFNFKAFATDNSGKVYLGTKTGLLVFDNLEPNTFPQFPEEILCYLYEGSRISTRKGKALHFQLSDPNTPFNLEFSVPAWGAFGNYMIRYRKVGEEVWQQLAGNTYHLGQLEVRPGLLRYEIQVSSGEGWSEVFSLELNIPPLWYQTFWFRIGIMTFLVVLIALTAYFFVRQNTRKLKMKNTIRQKMSELELQALQSQMNPHFLFNAMQSLQHFILTKQNEEGLNYLENLSLLLRYTLESSRKKQISLAEEFKMIGLYFDLENTRFNNRFRIKWELEDHLITLNPEIPAFMLQPFVENSLVHGLRNVEKPLLIIRALMKETEFVVEVEDNGIGRKASAQKKSPSNIHSSLATKIIKDRVEAMSQSGEQNIFLEIIDIESNEMALGTLVRLTFELKNL